MKNEGKKVYSGKSYANKLINMIGTNFNLHKFISSVQKGDINQTDILDKSMFEISNKPLFPEFEDYNNLKEMLKKGEKDIAKHCIERGCRLNINCADDTFDGTPLHLAVSLEYADIVELLLEKGADISSLNDSKETPLILAAVIGNSQIIDMILAKTKPNNYAKKQNLSHLHIACMRDNVDLVRAFLVSGGDVNKPVSKKSFYWPGFTSLHFAVEFRSIETAKILLDNGADITIQDSRGLTPLHLAFRKRNRFLVDLLLSKQYYYVSNPVDPEGLSHFQIACAFNDIEIVKDFLDKKIDVLPSDNSVTLDGSESFQFAIKNECIIVLEYLLKCHTSTIERNEFSIIDSAYIKKNQKILNLIISFIEKNIVNRQCPPSAVNSCSEKEIKSTMKRFSVSQYTNLHVAVLQKNKDRVKFILEWIHPSVVTVTDAQGKTPLHLAFETNEKELVDQLLPLHLELNENPKDSDNLSHFHISCATKNVSIVEDFIKKGVDINMRINMDSLVWAGCTPLHIAVIHRRLKVMKLLLDNGADFTLKNFLGISVYDLAIPRNYFEFTLDNDDENYGDWDFVEEILLTNVDRKFEIFEDQEITFLHIASSNGDIDMINRHVRADTINKCTGKNLGFWSGFTPLHFAAFFDKRDAVKVLLDHGADPSIQNSDQYTAAHYMYCCAIDDRMFLIPKNVYDKEAISTFHVACRSGNLNGVQHFLKMGVDVHERIPHSCSNSATDEEGKTPFHLAVSSGNPAVVELLIDNGADVDARDCYFNTPLHFCTDKEVFKILLDHGADPQALNCNLTTALEQFHCSKIENTIIAFESWGTNKITFDLGNVLGLSSLEAFLRYIERLTALGVDVNIIDQELYDDLIASLTENDVEIVSRRLKYKVYCKIELKSMKASKIDSRTTLYDLLLKSSRDIEKYSRNETLQKIVESDKDLRQKYPVYAYLIILQFKKGQKRAVLLEEGKKSLSILMNQWIDLVFDMILQFMDDYEIIYLNYAVSGQNIFQ